MTASDRSQKKSSDSEISLQILGFQSINPSLQEYLEMGAYFSEEYFDRYDNALEYVIPSIVTSLIALIFKYRHLFEISNYKDVGFGILLLFSSAPARLPSRIYSNHNAPLL